MSAQVLSKDRAHRITGASDIRQIYAHLMTMPLAANISTNPRLLRLVEEAIDLDKLTGAVVQLEHDMGRDIGRSELIETSDADTIFYARLSKTSGYTRFVKNRQSDPTRYVTINLSRDEDGDYELISVWIGAAFPPTPDDENATNKSKAFWSNHAVIYNGQPIVSSSLTKTWPYYDIS